MDLFSVPGKDQGHWGSSRSVGAVAGKYEQGAEGPNHLPNPPKAMLSRFIFRLPADGLFRLVRLLAFLDGDAAILAVMFT